MKRINRLYRIVNILMSIKNKPGIHVDELAKKCNVSESTIYRDISILEAIGVPMNHDHGMKLAPSLFIPNISLTLNEASLIKEACFKMLETEHSNETLEKVIEKLNSSIYLQNSPLYAQNKDLFANLEEYLKSGKIDKIVEDKQNKIVERIKLAITDSAYVEVKYYNKIYDQEVDEILQPISLIYQKNKWLLLAREKSQKKIRHIFIEFIEDVVVTNLKYNADKLMLDFNLSEC